MKTIQILNEDHLFLTNIKLKNKEPNIAVTLNRILKESTLAKEIDKYDELTTTPVAGQGGSEVREGEKKDEI